MRFTRGFLAGIGAATCLVLAGSLALLAVSAVIAFKGWPELRSSQAQAETATLAVAAVPGDAAKAPPVPLARPQRTRTAARPATRAAAREPSRTTARPGTGPVPTYDRPDVVRPRGSTGASQPAEPTQPEPEPRERRPADGVRETTKPLADGVRELTDDLGDSLQPASPTLDEAVDGLGETVGTTVEGIGDAVGNVLDGVLGRGPRARPIP